MCGIAGFAGGREHLDQAKRLFLLDRMCRVITHRGPDDQGMVVKDGVALGMRRLSIIDLAGGHQPMATEDGSVTIVFNGEIYNYRELQQDLAARGHRFRTASDTEVILHSYEEYGAECVKQLRGMFAFAIWDERTRQLFLARDRVGKKPLFFSRTGDGTLVFGSELKSLLQHPDVRREINPSSLDAFLTVGYVPDPLCVFKDIHKLAPGCYLWYGRGQVEVAEYWDFTYESVKPGPEEEYIEELRELIDDAVRVRLVSDVPLGAFLSGGIDSSTVVSAMARHSEKPVKTFSIGFHEDSHNELKYARLAAKSFGTDHHEYIVTPEVCHIVDELVWHLDEPFADSSAIPTYMVSKLAREHVTVVLSGDGGDELFAGYTRYLKHESRDQLALLTGPLGRVVLQTLCRLLPAGALGRNYIYNLSLQHLCRYVDSVSIFTSLHKQSLYTEHFRRQLHGDSTVMKAVEQYASRVRSDASLDTLLYIDSKTYLPGDILTKVDRMSMAVSLEARVPFLDHKLIEFVTRIPASLKMRGREAKYILKRSLRGIVPREILDRSKRGFGMPIQKWINEQLSERILGTILECRTLERGYFQPTYLRSLINEHRRGRRDHSNALWALFMLETWHRVFDEMQRLVPETSLSAAPLRPTAIQGVPTLR